MSDNKDEEKTYGTIEAAKRIDISLERMYYWVNRGVLNPVYKQSGIREFRRYTIRDIEKGIMVKNLVDKENYTLKGAIEILDRLYGKIN